MVNIEAGGRVSEPNGTEVNASEDDHGNKVRENTYLQLYGTVSRASGNKL